MAFQLGSTQKVDGDAASYKAGPDTMRDDTPSGPVARRWRDFLSGPPLPRGLSLVIVTFVSVLLWAGIAGLIYAALHR